MAITLFPAYKIKVATGIQLPVLSIWPYLHSIFKTLVCQPLIHSLPIMAPV